jgi:aminomethyltransferase
MKTALYYRHVALGAKMISFAGWEMPLQYKGIVAEHQTVRQTVGLFDVSHMGRILVRGADAEPFLDYLSTNKIAGKAPGTVTYTVWCHENGGCVDDLMIYKQSSEEFAVVVNASNRQKDLEHLRQQSEGFHVLIQDRFEEDGILALQGPLAEELLSSFIPLVKEIKPMHFMITGEQDQACLVSRTGYTGAGGFEIYASSSTIEFWWDRLLEYGKAYGLEPVGLGARDTLRLEMGFALYGHELADDIAPIETVAGWAVKWDKKDFLGKKALEKLEQSGKKRFQHGLLLVDKGIAREGYPIFKGEKQIGKITSGTFSPTLNQAIAIGMVEEFLDIESEVQVQIRQQMCRAKVVQLPFIRKNR